MTLPVAATARRVWEPNAGSQTLFLACPIPEVLLEGTRGSGKTDALLMDFAQHVGQGYGDASRGILFRETYPQLQDVVSKARRWFRQIFPEARWNGDYYYRWPTGETLYFRQMAKPDDYWDYHGHEYPWIGWEELANWASIECYESMHACNRSSHPDLPRKVRSTTNPYGAGRAWIKKYFVDPAPAGRLITEEREIPAFDGGALVRRKVLAHRVRIHGSYIENPKLLVNDPLYLANIEKISDLNRKKAWLFGDWNISVGGMFDDLWIPDRHILRPFPIPTSWRIDRSLDWGSSKPFSVGWWAESDGTPATMPDGRQRTFPRGTLIRIGEWYGCTGKPNEGLRMTAKNVALGILDREREMKIVGRVQAGPADSSIFDTIDDACIAQNMASVGVRWVPADKRPGSRKNGWELMRTRLEAAATGDDTPGLYVFETCRDFIRTVPSMTRDKRNPDDVDTDAEDHAGDETRYRVLGPKAEARDLKIGMAH